MAEVFVACEASNTDRLLVVKRILPHLAQNPEFVDSFAREAKLSSGIHHPNVIRIVDIGEWENVPFIVMEYLEGVSLKELLTVTRNNGVALPIGVVLHLITQACAGAHAAHELLDPTGRPYGLVHRDITPHNLMVDEHAHVKLLDFGIAKAREGMDQTRTGVLKGKIAYMSPEQCRQERLDRRADVFSLAVVTYQLLTGEKPFSATSELATMQAIILNRYRPLLEARPEVPAALARAVEEGMASEAARRPPTALAFSRLLMEAALHAGIEVRPGDAEQWLRDTLAPSLRVKRAAVERAAARTLGSLSDPGEPNTNPSMWSTGVSRIREFVPSARGDAAAPSPSSVGPVPPSSITRALTVGVAAVCAVAMGGASFQWASENHAGLDAFAAAPPSESSAITLLLGPTDDAVASIAFVEPVRRHLEYELGRTVMIELADDPLDAAKAIAAEIQFALLPEPIVALAQQLDPAVKVIAVEEVDRTATLDGVLVVRRDGPIKRLADLPATMVVCWVDEWSTTGYALPRRFLDHMGVAPERLIPRISGSHDQVLRDVLDGKCEVGATHDSSLFAAAQRGIASHRLRILGITGTTAHDMFVANGQASDELVDELRHALLGFDPSRSSVFPTADGSAITGFLPPAAGVAYEEP